MSVAVKEKCPICEKLFALQILNQHANECIAQSDSMPSKSMENQKLERSNTTSGMPSKTTKQTNRFHPFFDKSKPAHLAQWQNRSKTSQKSVSSSSLHNSDTTCTTNGTSQNLQSSFTTLPTQQKKTTFQPLAERMRPLCLQDYFGQEHAVGKNTLLGSLLETEDIPSMILWGPPGCGKTTLARIIAEKSKSHSLCRFVQLSATTSGIADVKEATKVALNEQKMFKRKTILFIDEIHRFNKLQQDAFLPHVENGTITLIGATTENPSFQVNSALLSRCRVIVLNKLCIEDIVKILTRTLKLLDIEVLSEDCDISCFELNNDRSRIFIEQKGLETLAGLTDGDARTALNALQMAVDAAKARGNVEVNNCDPTSDLQNKQRSEVGIITTQHIKDGLQKSHLLYDRAGEEHYNIISALHKSVRGSDENAAMYWLVRMLEGGEDPVFIARRLIWAASEDIGLADPMALSFAVSTLQGCQALGMPACGVLLAQLVAYLARAPKNWDVYAAFEAAKSHVKNYEGPLPSVPLHLRNASTKLLRDLGYGKDYKAINGVYLPEELKGINFFRK